MRVLASLFLVLVIAASAFGETDAASLATVAALRCEALDRGKLATRKADIYRSEASRAVGPGRVQAEQKETEFSEQASAAFEEAGRLKTRLKGMVETYVSQRKLEWYQTVDLARRLKIAEQIRLARDLAEQGCP